MSYRISFTPASRCDIERLYRCLAEQELQAGEAAREALNNGFTLLRDFPFTSRKADPENPFLRELIIPFGGAGYVALFEIENDTTVTVLAVRHQREDDYY